MSEETRKILKELEVGTTYSGVDVICRQYKEIERLNNIINDLEKDLIEYFKKEYPDRKLEDYNLKNCTYDYALVILDKLQELKGSDK